MTPARKLVYDFLSLPYHVQLAVVKDLALYAENDCQLSDAEARQWWFRRATEQAKLETLRERVAKERKDLSPLV